MNFRLQMYDNVLYIKESYHVKKTKNANNKETYQ
jgi:hypothetical protein